MTLVYRTFLGYVSARIVFEGNEWTGALAKASTANPTIEFELPVPLSHDRRVLKERILPAWQEWWDVSDKGRHTYELIPKVSRDLLFLSPPTTALLTGHEPFKQYLKKFHCASSKLVVCCEIGTPARSYYHCTLTDAWHLGYLPSPPKSWMHGITFRPALLSKLRNIYSQLREMFNLTS